MDQDLIRYLDQRFGSIDQRFEKLEAEVRHNRTSIENLRTDMETEVRHNRVLIEGLRSDIQGVAEGVATANERLDREIEARARERREDRAQTRLHVEDFQSRIDDHDGRLVRLEASA